MSKHKPLPPLERLNELFEVVPIEPPQFGVQSGLIWKVRRGNRRAGSVAGSLHPSTNKPGRFDWRSSVSYQNYFVSRIIYFMVSGVDPGVLEVDHEDRNPFNNNAENLRLGCKSLQTHNQSIRKNNTSGVVGVCWSKPHSKWVVRLANNNESLSLGYFTCKVEAARTYNKKVLDLGLDKLGKPLNNLEVINCGCSVCKSPSSLS